jgi:hypothetical protein
VIELAQTLAYLAGWAMVAGFGFRLGWLLAGRLDR